MKRLIWALFVSAIIGTVTCSMSYKNDVIKKKHYDEIIEDYSDDDMFFNQKSCPRNCICKPSASSTVARCSRLEVGTQKFGSDITDLVVEDYHRKYSIVLSDKIFSKLGLSQVSTIKIVNSVISSISPTAFAGLNDLFSVNLTGNQIEILHPDIFSTNEKLYLLSLSNNPLTLSQMNETYTLLSSTSIQELDLSRCNLTHIPKNTFSKMKSLMYINLNENKLSNINSHVFSELQDLEEIDLSNNNLNNIAVDLFEANSEMTSLNIGGNPLDHIPSMKIPELLTLNIKNSKIKYVGPSMFENMAYLANLNLSGNGIQKIYDSAFDELSELSYLDLSDNDLELISSTIINNNGMLDVFKIKNNPKLKRLPEEGFLCNDKQFTMYLFDASYCSIEVIPDKTFVHMLALNQLYLKGNKIYSLGKSLQSLLRLTELDLSYNAIESLDKNTFSENRDLSKLNLAGNPIVTLSSEIFFNNNVLRWLDLSSCQLLQLWENGDSHPSNILNTLHYLNISNNQLNTVRKNELEMSKELYTLDISQNPLQCSEEFESLIFWVKEREISLNTHTITMENMKTIEKKIGKANPLSWEILAMQVCGYIPSTTTPLPETSTAAAIVTEKVKDDKSENDKDYEDDYYDDYDNQTDISYDSKSDEKVKNNDTKTPLYNLVDDINVNKENTYESELSDAIEMLNKEKNVLQWYSDNKKGDKTSEEFQNGEKDMLPLYEKEGSTLDPDILEKIKEIDLNDDYKSDVVGDFEYSLKVLKFNEDGTVSEITSEDSPRTITRYIFFFVYILVLFVLIAACMVVVKLVRRSYNRAHPNTIITVSNANNRRGFIYQQLSEDLTCPKTPIIKKNTLINNTNETNPCYHKVNADIV